MAGDGTRFLFVISKKEKMPLDKLHLTKYNRAKDKQGGNKDGIL